jgi:hypothetical protein
MRRTADARLQGQSDRGNVKDQALRTRGRAWSLWSFPSQEVRIELRTKVFFA